MHPFASFFKEAACVLRSANTADAIRVADALDAVEPTAETQLAAASFPLNSSLERALDLSKLPIAHGIRGALDSIHWHSCAFDPIPQAIGERMAYCELLGPTGSVFCNDVRCGLFYQDAELYYPFHSHDAREIYYVISGTARWRMIDEDFADRPPGSFIHHPSKVPHAMHTQSEPILAMWCWTGDLRGETYRMDE